MFFYSVVMHRKVRIPLAFSLAAILLVANVVYEWPYSVRFMYAPLNAWAAVLLALSIPVSIAYLGMAFVRRTARYITLFTAAVLLIPSLLFAVFAVLDKGSDELQDSLVAGLATYRVYMRDSGSAVSQPFTILRKELDTGVGIKLVRTIWSDEHYGKACLRSVDASTLEIEIDGDFFRKKIAI